MSKLSTSSILYFASLPAGFIAVTRCTGNDVKQALKQLVVKGLLTIKYENSNETCYAITTHGKAELLIMQINRRLSLGLPVARLQAQLLLISTEKLK